ncbi:NUDIX hydrolase [Halorarum halophilum]|uniref:NUDIX hydrolase n=1 Tax=Halorarum halophilum TaxID=2743090 RepID=A0A7D5GEX6_9EURY|nr:NUDIX hydrolase [Halobaculum halophilum]QLG27788.1 NUDIX hydrolase [Halobaculum halophilum]
MDADDPDDDDGPASDPENPDDTPLDWETLGSEVDYTCPGFDVRRDDVRLPDGTETDFHYVDEPPAVVVLPFTPEGDVVLVEEWRQAVGRVNRGLPAGTVEAGDDVDLEAAARRELREETGHKADSLTHLVTVEPENGIANSIHHHFLARGCRPTAEQDLDFNESIRPVVADYDAFRTAVFDGEIRDGRAILAVSRYEAHPEELDDEPADG